MRPANTAITICAVLSFLLHCHAIRSKKPQTIFFLSGVSLGMAIGIRLSFAPLIVPFLFAIAAFPVGTFKTKGLQGLTSSRRKIHSWKPACLKYALGEHMVCYCLIRHYFENRILGIEGDCGWMLPQVELPDQWIAKQVNLIGEKIHTQLGIRVTVLRHLLSDRQGEICELENHDRSWKPCTGASWLERSEIANLNLENQDHRECINNWWNEKESGTIPAKRPPWERLGWFETATQWIDKRLDEIGEPKHRQIEQWKAAWPASCVLRIKTPLRKLFFKAYYQKSAPESTVISMLSQNWPKHLPQVVSSDTTKRWLLMEDFGNKSLESASIKKRGKALGLFAEIQRYFLQKVDLLIGMGCADMRSEVLFDRFEQLLNDDSALRPGVRGELNTSQIAELRAALPLIRAKFEQLENSEISKTLVHSDFRGGNIALNDLDIVFFDWSDAVIAHPFYSVNRYFDFIPPPKGTSKLLWRFDPSDHRRNQLLDAYLDKWTKFGSKEQVTKAFSISRQLNPVFLSVRWCNELPYHELDSPRGQLRVRSILRQLKNLLWVIRRISDA